MSELWFTMEEARQLLGEVLSVAHTLRKANGNGGRFLTSENLAGAWKIVGEQYGCDVDELKRAIGVASNPAGRKRGKYRKNGNGSRKAVETKFKKFRDLYREWVEKHDWIPPDSVWEHFGPVDTVEVSDFRDVLVREGYIFVTFDGEGYRVQKRPEKEKTVADLVGDLAVAFEKGQSVAAAAVLIDLMEKVGKK